MTRSLFMLLVRRVALARTQRRGLAAVAVCAALLCTTFVVLNALALDGRQQADQVLGDHQYGVSDNLPVGNDAPDDLTEQLTQRLRRDGATGVDVVVESFDVAVAGTDVYLNTGPQPIVGYVETADPEGTFPGSYSLLSGSWPRSPGEVVLSESLAEDLDYPDRVSVFSGAASWRVSGIARRVFGQDGLTLVAGAGTWQSLARLGIERGFPTASAQLTVLWDGGIAVDAVTRVLAEMTPGGENAPSVARNLVDRERLAAEGATPLTSRFALVWLLPSLALTSLTAGFAVGSARARLVDRLRRLGAVGLRYSRARRALLTGVCAAVASATFVGAVVGFGLGLLARILVVEPLWGNPLSAVPAPWWTALRLVVVALGTAAIVGFATVRPTTGFSSRRRVARVEGPARTGLAILRRAAGLGAVFWGIRGVLAATDLDALGLNSSLIVVGLLLLTADLLAPTVALLSIRRPRSLVARRLIEGDRGRHTAAVLTLACCLGAPIAVATYYATETRTRAAQDLAQVPPGQIVLDAGDSGPGVMRRLGVVVAQATNAQETEVGMVRVPRGDARFTQAGTIGAFGLYVVASVEDAAQVLGGPLTPEAADVLNAGGVLDWSGAAGPQSIEISTGKQVRVAGPLPTYSMTADPAIEYAAAGLLLENTATRLGLGHTNQRLIFSDLTDSQVKRAVDAATSSGFRADYVQYHLDPPPTKLPPEAYLAAGGLSLMGFLVLLAVFRTQALAAREHAARLLAVGLPTRWSRGVLLVQVSLVVVLGSALGALTGLIPIAVFAYNQVAMMVLDVPVGFLAASISCSLVGSIAALAGAWRSLDRVDDQ